MGGGQDDKGRADEIGNRDLGTGGQGPLPSYADVSGPCEEVDHPDHYNQGEIETIDFIKDREHLGFARLNAIKYIDRSGVKVGESKEQSIRKAIWYLERELGMHKKGSP